MAINLPTYRIFIAWPRDGPGERALGVVERLGGELLRLLSERLMMRRLCQP
jgi:hypothetical protein